MALFRNSSDENRVDKINEYKTTLKGQFSNLGHGETKAIINKQASQVDEANFPMMVQRIDLIVKPKNKAGICRLHIRLT